MFVGESRISPLWCASADVVPAGSRLFAAATPLARTGSRRRPDHEEDEQQQDRDERARASIPSGGEPAALPSLRPAPVLAVAPGQRHLALRASAPVDAVRLLPEGRPSGGVRYPLTVDGTRGHAIGVDLGGTKILAGVVTRDGEILRRHERPTPPDSQEDARSPSSRPRSPSCSTTTCRGRLRRPGADRPGAGPRRSPRQPAARTTCPCATRCTSASGCRSGSTTTRTPPRSASGGSAPAAASTTSSCSRSAPGVGGGVISNGAPVPRRARRRRRARPRRHRPRRAAVPGALHRARPPRGVRDRASRRTLAAREAFGPAADAHRLVRLANEGDAQAQEDPRATSAATSARASARS